MRAAFCSICNKFFKIGALSEGRYTKSSIFGTLFDEWVNRICNNLPSDGAFKRIKYEKIMRNAYVPAGRERS